MSKKVKKLEKKLGILIFIIFLIICTYFNIGEEGNTDKKNKVSYELCNIPEYNGEPYVEINKNVPKFTSEDLNLEEDYYSKLEDKRVRNVYDKN